MDFPSYQRSLPKVVCRFGIYVGLGPEARRASGFHAFWGLGLGFRVAGLRVVKQGLGSRLDRGTLTRIGTCFLGQVSRTSTQYPACPLDRDPKESRKPKVSGLQLGLRTYGRSLQVCRRLQLKGVLSFEHDSFRFRVFRSGRNFAVLPSLGFGARSSYKPLLTLQHL